AAELRLDGVERRLDVGRRRDVALDTEEALRWRRRVVGDRHSIGERGEALGARQPDATRSTRDEHDASGVRHVAHWRCSFAFDDQRMTALAAVIPVPKPTKSTRSPSLTRPSSSAAASANGTDADDVFPVWSSTMAVRSRPI